MTSEINSNIASKPLLWRIIDLSYSEVAPSTLSQSDQEGIRTLISSALQIGQTNECTVLAPSAERCLRSLAKINILEFTRNACFIAKSRLCTSNKNFIREEDYLNKDVSYILELLRYTYEMIDMGIPLRTCSGETVPRASRDRRKKAMNASSDAEGYHLDCNISGFTRHDLAKDMTWGREFSLCERAGSKIENNRKILDNTLKVQKTLKDMHKILIDTIVLTSGGAISREILDIIPKMLMPGFCHQDFSFV
ncbi:unnamed protein product [Rhizophagus irregularis]|nr:unnamed protein product [Rhizophagus irregularis]